MTGCTYGDPPCGAEPARRYLPGHRCAAHTPARLLGLAEPDAARSCATGPGRCYCGKCPNWAAQPATPAAATVVDLDAIRSGKRRSSPHEYAGARTTPRRKS